VTGLSIAQVADVIRNVPEEFLATVRPITALKKGAQVDTTRSHYATIVPQVQASVNNVSPSFGISGSGSVPSCDELEDCGNYDDEEDDDVPPPLPPRTEDALIIVDPPPTPTQGIHLLDLFNYRFLCFGTHCFGI